MSDNLPSREHRAVLTFRLPPKLGDRLRQSAKENQSSLNEEMIRRLEKSYEPGDMEAMLRRIIAEQREEALMARYAEEVGRV